ncbi:MAG TPA: WG repeat-containing protein [Chryseosolibacter sp.]|nr:WG repeat-containing protein [Chryseosolibacter sp.]
MISKVAIAVLVFLYSGVSFAQLGGVEKSATKDMAKHRWQKAEVKLRKTLAKDTLNPSIRYLTSVFYFHRENPAYNLDSAYYYVGAALDDYALTAARERDKLKKMFVDSLTLISLRIQIDSRAFEVARQAGTEEGYLKFLRDFPSAVQRDLAASLRDEVAYQDALRENSHEAFFRFLNRYPQAERAEEARARYDRLLYQEATKDHHLASYEKFLEDHPETPYRKEICRHIFEISTADGSVDSFLSFVTRYPATDPVKRAGQIIFHILAEEEDPRWPRQFLNDSLQNLLKINSVYLIPVLKNSHYGFIGPNGGEILPPVYQDIHSDYLCGHITDEVLILDDRLVARSGSVIYNGSVTELTDMGIGFLKINTGSDLKVIHKAGFVFQDSVQDARVLSKRFIAVKKNDAWMLYTLTGKLLNENRWDDITAMEDVVCFKKGAKSYLAPTSQVAKSADGDPPRLSEPFDVIKPWPQGLLWGKARDYEGVMNQSLHSVIRFDKHTLHPAFFGATAKLPNGYVLFNHAGRKSTVFQQVNIFDPWVTVKKGSHWYVFDTRAMENASKGYDTLLAEGPFPVGFLKDSVYVHFSQDHVSAFPRSLKISFIPGMDSTSFLLVEENIRTKSVYDRRGKKLFSAAFDEIEYAGQGIFVVGKKERKGLLSMTGQTLLPTEFDAIGSVKDQVVSILKNRRFGSYHVALKKFIKPQYDRNVLPYAPTIVSTFKGGYYGLVGWDNKPISAFAFDEIKYWDDSVALVRNGSSWNFYNLYERKNIESNLHNIIMVKNSMDEKIAIIQKDKSFGVISNRRNVVIPVAFTEIINLGSAEEPLYFTEKHIAEASLYIVIYYDASGNMLRKEIYEDAADYDKIYCSDN